ncbi:MAG: ABC transporter substrate-binding protein [Pseudomonadota bacterium]
MSKKTIPHWTKHDDALLRTALARGASRRDLLQMMVAGGLTLAAGGAVLGRASAALAAEPVSGGSIRVAGATSSTADTLDPAISSNSTDYSRICAVYNRLTFLDSEGVPQMELAESIESDDAKVWTVKLRPDVAFHDGHTLSSADVVFSLKRHLDPAVGSKVNSIASQMSEIKAVDPQTVEITLQSPNADLPVIFSLHHFMIVADGTTDFSKGNGTGAFVVEEFSPGVRSIMTRNPNYFKENQPYLDAFEFFAIPDENARLNALVAGDVQLASALNSRSLRLLEASPGVEASVSNSGNYTNLNMRLDMSPGDKMDFVTGIKYLINRELIENSVMRGLAILANDQPVSPANRFHNADLAPKPYDPEKAKHHFEKAGLLGVDIPVVASEAAGSSVDMATVVQQAGAEIGMNLNVERVPADGYWSNYWLKAPVHFGNINPRPTPDILFSLLYESNAPWNESRYKSEKFDKMLVEARGELDFDKRKAMYDEMQVIVADEAGTAIPVYLSSLDGKSQRIQGLKPNPLGGMMGYAFAEYIWLDG